jgi:hypothetical protein
MRRKLIFLLAKSIFDDYNSLCKTPPITTTGGASNLPPERDCENYTMPKVKIKSQSCSAGQNGGARPGAGRKPKPPGEKAVTVSLSMSPEMYQQLTRLAESKGLAITDTIRDIIAKNTRKISGKIAKEN